MGLLLLAYAALSGEHPNLIHHVARDLGIALVIAFVIIISIEQRTRKEQNEIIEKFLSQSGEHLHRAILGVEFPPNMYEFSKEQLMKAPFFRTETDVNYTIKRPNVQKTRFGCDIVILEVQFKYVVRNMGPVSQNFPLRFFVEEEGLDQLAGAGDPIVLKPLEVFIEGKLLSGELLSRADDKWDDVPGLKRYACNVALDPGEAKTISITHATTKLAADLEVWRSIHPCDGITFSVQFPEELVVSVDVMHPDRAECTFKNESNYRGRINRPLFPQHGFMFWWHPKAGRDTAGVAGSNGR